MLSAAGYGCSVAGSARHRACDPYERRDDAMVSSVLLLAFGAGQLLLGPLPPCQHQLRPPQRG